MSHSRYYPRIFTKELRNIVGNLSQGSRCPDLDSNGEPAEGKAKALGQE
jgi:hypothetical protein